MISKVKVIINRTTCLLIHAFLRRLPARKEKHYDVVVVGCNLIGDYILWISTLESYRKKYEGKRSLLICNDIVEEISVLSNVFTDVISFNVKHIVNSPKYHYNLMKRLRKISAEHVISPAYKHQVPADLISAMVNAPQKTCYRTHRITTIKGKIGSFIWKRSRRIVDSYFDGFYNDFIDYPDGKDHSEIKTIEYFTQKVIDDSYSYRLSDISFLTIGFKCPVSSPFVFLSASSSRTIKDWPIERFAEVMEVIPSSFAILLSGHGEYDMKKAEELINADGGKHVVYNYVNKTTVVEMIGLISNSTFVIGNDSAAVHIAAAARVPSICITHGACFGQFVPYPISVPELDYHPRCVYKKMDCFGCDYNCIKDYKEPLYCLRQISVEMVAKELENLLRTIKEKKDVNRI